MSRKFFNTLFLFTFLPLASAQAFNWNFFTTKPRQHIHIVGSSTISPLMTAVSEEFVRGQSLQNIPTLLPIVESIGTGNGFKVFCGGSGSKYPDFVNASRPIKDSELELCHNHGVKQIIEIKIGYDGIVIGNLAGGKKIKLTREQIFLALAAKIPDKKTGKLVDNFYETWDEIDPTLPKTKILVYGPPSTSGTRDVLEDIILEEVCFAKKEFNDEFHDFAKRKKQCHTLRDDDKFVASGENDHVIIEHLKSNPQSFGIFGYNFLVENEKTIQAASINGIAPNFASISSKKYALSRPLFVYFKKDNLNSTPHMREFVTEIINPETIGRKGYLVNSGLISLSPAELAEVRKNILSQL